MKLRTRGIRFRALLLVALCVIPYAINAVLSTEERRRDELRQAREQIRTLARVIAAEHAENLAHAGQLLAAAALSVDASHPLLGPQCAAHLARLLDLHRGYRQMAVATPTGDVLCAAKPVGRPVNLGDRAYFQHAVESKGLSRSSVITGRLGSGAVIVVAQALLDRRSQVSGVMVATIDLDWIGRRLEGAALPSSSGAAIVDAHGLILRAFPSDTFKEHLLPDADEFARRVALQDEGFMESLGLDGVRRVIGYAKISELEAPLYVRVGFPQSTINEVAAQTLRNALLAVGIVVLITLTVGWIGAGLLVIRPIARLTAAAARMGQGDLRARTGLPHTGDAIGQLASKLDALASHAQRKTRALTALSAGNRTILRERDEATLLNAMCDVAVRHAGYPFAIVNYARHDEARSLQRMAAAGDDQGLFAGAVMTWSEEASGRGTVGTAIRTGERCLIRSIASHPRAIPWQQEALRRGYKSVVSFPVKVDHAVVGAFTLMALEENAFDEDELELLDEMASDLSFGIAVIRARLKREEAERLVERAATHDSLTGLPNASWFLTQLGLQVAQAAAGPEPMTVLVVHLPRLQDLYESLGFDPGNAVVKAIAQRLRELPLCGARLARTGLEDFALALPKLDAASAASTVASIGAAFHAPLAAGGANVEMQAAIGASFYPGHGDDGDLLLRRAGIAAREAARKGIDYLAYKGVTERENPARLEIAAELRSAIEKRDLHLQYQPKVDAKSGEVVACEALLRWSHAVKGPISPAQFIPVAEQTGLIRQLTDLVLDMAVRQQRAWVEQGLSIPIAVNLSTRNLYDSRLLSRIEGLLNTWGISPELLEFEITESALMEEPDVARALVAALRSGGSKIYIDDFGTGYSSLSYLVRLPVHALKIDRAFVVQMTKSAEVHAVVTAMISMAHSLHLKVVAEGVENERELALLRDMGCDQIQGYHAGRPMSAADLLKLVQVRPAATE